MQITEALLAEPGDIRRFIQQAVDYWPRLLAVHFTLHSTEAAGHSRASVTVDEECSQVVDLLQQTWRVISAGGQCRLERCFQVARDDTSDQYVALKTAAILLILPVISTTIRGCVIGDDN